MDGAEKIREGLKLIKEGCAETKCCYNCPFDKIGCIDLQLAQNGFPATWEIEDAE